MRKTMKACSVGIMRSPKNCVSEIRPWFLVKSPAIMGRIGTCVLIVRWSFFTPDILKLKPALIWT
ncbi:MAG: hypothetical protein EUB_03884 [Eubacterium sp.]